MDDGKAAEAAEAAESEEMLVSNPVDGLGARQRECKVDVLEASDLLGHAPLDSDLLPNLMDTAEGLPDGGHNRGLASHLMGSNEGLSLERLPSPPPLPLEWELIGNEVASSHGFLFDFGQFDSKRGACGGSRATNAWRPRPTDRRRIPIRRLGRTRPQSLP